MAVLMDVHPYLGFRLLGAGENQHSPHSFWGTMIRKFVARSFNVYVANSLVNSWIRFAVRHEVQELDLQLYEDEYLEDHEDLYLLHSFLFTCGSIDVLKLRICKLNLPTFVHLPLLKTLELCQTELTDVEIKVLTSGCPLLENVTLKECKSKSNLNIFAPNVNLKLLRILNPNYEPYDDTQIGIFAPYVLSLELGGFYRNNFIIRNLSSIASVIIEFEEDNVPDDPSEGDQLVKLLRDLSHAVSLRLCGWCVQILGRRDMVDTSCLNLHATYLDLKIGLSKWVWDYLGIALLLRSSPHVESLFIEIFEDDAYQLSDDWSNESSEIYARKYWKSEGLSLSCRFSNLKTIQIYGFMGSKSSSLKEHQHIEIDDFMEGLENEVELIRFLLKNSRKLDKMIISTTDRFAMESELLLNLTRRLLVLPRASQNAEIVLE